MKSNETFSKLSELKFYNEIDNKSNNYNNLKLFNLNISKNFVIIYLLQLILLKTRNNQKVSPVYFLLIS